MTLRSRPPAWKPNAIPSAKGWRDPITNELILPVKGITYRAPSREILETLEQATSPTKEPEKLRKNTKKHATKKVDSVEVEDFAATEFETEGSPVVQVDDAIADNFTKLFNSHPEGVDEE